MIRHSCKSHLLDLFMIVWIVSLIYGLQVDSYLQTPINREELIMGLLGTIAYPITLYLWFIIWDWQVPKGGEEWRISLSPVWALIICVLVHIRDGVALAKLAAMYGDNWSWQAHNADFIYIFIDYLLICFFIYLAHKMNNSFQLIPTT